MFEEKSNDGCKALNQQIFTSATEALSTTAFEMWK